ncbi:phosphoribosyl-AMP cyclohydrolase [Aureimonas populi]|uniref:phosphoribosyl-AMP cyclohydrolase n=1 Tax=Aureimonas populi TaxID=1701758 RepID=A0ABW5CPH7_9HYPH|nr:phosphoribosyl-AMP cyclohydrolase [Aureimonas populi]
MTGALFAPPSPVKSEVDETSRLTPRFDAAGLVTAIVTDWHGGELLMVAHMNAEALDRTIATRTAHYYSRSRATLWKKGETSGALQHVRELRVDCDQDAVWLKVEVERPQDTCHTHRPTCFYRCVDLNDGRSLVTDVPQADRKAGG